MQFLTGLFAENKTLFLAASVFAGLICIGLVIFILRRAFGRRLHLPRGVKGRQPRLGVVDAYDLDRERQLVIVRRDNVEHLIMIGGPNDLVIESAIIRAELRSSREKEFMGHLQSQQAYTEQPVQTPAATPAQQPARTPNYRSEPRSEPRQEPRGERAAPTHPLGSQPSSQTSSQPSSQPSSQQSPPPPFLGSQPTPAPQQPVMQARGLQPQQSAQPNPAQSVPPLQGAPQAMPTRSPLPSQPYAARPLPAQAMPVTPATASPAPVPQPATRPGNGAPAHPPGTSEQNAAEVFASMEDEMARLLGRQSSGNRP